MLNNDNQLYEYNNQRFSKLKLFLIALFLLADSRFLYLIPLPDILGGAASNKTLVGIISLVCFLLITILTRKLCLGNYGGFVLFLYIFLFFQSFFEEFKFQYGINAIIFNLTPYLVFLMYFGINSFLTNEKNFETFCLLCESITVLLSILLLIQLIVYNRSHFIFLNFTLNDWFTKYHVTAKGRFTVVAEGFIRITVLISFYEVLNKMKLSKGKLRVALLSLLLGFLAIVFVDQSRIYAIQIIVSLLFMYFIVKKDKLNSTTIISIVFLVFIATIILFPKISSIINTMGNSNDGSNYARMGAIKYYLSIIKDYFFTGIGIVIPDEGTIEYFFVKGAEGIYNFDDIGIFGVYASMGMFMVIWYLLVLIKNFKLSFSISGSTKRALAFGLSIMMLTGILTASYLDKERIMSLVLTMSVISYCANESRMKEK